MVFGIGNKDKLTRTEKLGVSHGMVMADASRSVSDMEAIRELGINKHMITDDKVDQILEGMATLAVVEKDPISKKDVVKKYTVPKWAAAFIARSQLIRTSYNEKHDAYIGMLQTEDLLDQVAMKMTEEEYENGGGLLLQAIQLLCDTAWSDSIDGRKAKILKVSPKTYEISWRNEKKGGKGGYGNV
jgi:hypothetical protein